MFEEGAEVVGTDVADFRAGGIISPDGQEILLSGGSSNTLVRHWIMGDVPSDWEDPGSIPPQRGSQDGKYAAEEVHGGKVDISAA